jgi:hypothetical protein
MRSSRRTFLAVLGAASAAGGIGFGGFRLNRRAAAWIRTAMAGWLGETATVTALGVEYLTRHPDEADHDTLQARLSLRLAALAALGGAEGVALGFDEAIRRDYEAGLVETFGGWILSQTELRLCAWLTTAPGQGASGLFAPDALPDGGQIRWTAPMARLIVPATVDRLELPVRSGAPYAQRVEVRFRGSRIDEITVGGPLWHPLRYGPLDRGAGGPAQVELRVSPVWMPENDFRTIGIGLGEVPWLAAAAPSLRHNG